MDDLDVELPHEVTKKMSKLIYDMGKRIIIEYENPHLAYLIGLGVFSFVVKGLGLKFRENPTLEEILADFPDINQIIKEMEESDGGSISSRQTQ